MCIIQKLLNFRNTLITVKDRRIKLHAVNATILLDSEYPLVVLITLTLGSFKLNAKLALTLNPIVGSNRRSEGFRVYTPTPKLTVITSREATRDNFTAITNVVTIVEAGAAATAYDGGILAGVSVAAIVAKEHNFLLRVVA